MKLEKVTISGAAYIRSVQGYYKPTLVVLTNSELYIYADVDSSKHSEMFVMSSGVFVKSLDAVEDPEIDIAQHNYDTRANKFHPIEILLSNQQSSTTRNALILYFRKLDDHDKWKRSLQKVTGSE